MLVSELQHRTRNLLAVVHGVMDQTRRESQNFQDFVAAFHDRLRALGRVQGLLSRLSEGSRVVSRAADGPRARRRPGAHAGGA